MTTNTKTVAFVNLKGGVGKTTSAIGTAEALARLGHTVTVRDADPSGAATLWAHKALSAGRPLPFGVEVVNRFTVAAPAEEEWVLIDTPPLQTDLVEAAVDAASGCSSPPPAPSTWNACWRPSGRSTSPPRCC